MAINQNPYCLVNLPDRNNVIAGPMLLPANWVTADGKTWTNINNTQVWSDTDLIAIGWYPYSEIDAGAPEPLPKRYNRTLTEFVIQVDRVERTAVYTEYTITQYDDAAPITPIDHAQIPGDQRQFVSVPYESEDRLVIGRIFQTWNEPDDIYALRATLYTREDASGMTVKIHDDATGNYLYNMDLLPPGDPGNPFPPEDNAWFAETQSGAWGQHLERKPWRFYIFKGVDLTPEMRLPMALEQVTHMIRWNPNGIVASGVSGRRP